MFEIRREETIDYRIVDTRTDEIVSLVSLDDWPMSRHAFLRPQYNFPYPELDCGQIMHFKPWYHWVKVNDEFYPLCTIVPSGYSYQEW
jgi:hypothetical protein